MPVFQGKLGGSVSTKGIVSATIVSPGFLQSGNGASNYEAMSLYFSGAAGGIDISPDTWKGGQDEDIDYGIRKGTGKFELLGTDLAVFSNLCLQMQGAGTTAGRLVGTVNVFAQDEDGQKLNLIALPALTDYIGTPASSTMNGVTLENTEWVCEEKKRSLNLALNWGMTDAMIAFANTSSAAYITTGAGVVGGTTCALVQITNARASRVLPSGWHTVQFTPNGGSMSDLGILDQCHASLKLVASPVQFNTGRALYVQYTVKGRTIQGRLPQLVAASYNGMQDGLLGLFSIAGETPTFVNARVTFQSHGFGNDQGWLEFSSTATIPISQCNFTSALAPVFTRNEM